MKMCGGVDVDVMFFFISALVQNEWSASRLGGFNPSERDRNDHRHEGLTVGLNDTERWKFLTVQGFELKLSVVHAVVMP
jgi:hypothetical protein